MFLNTALIFTYLYFHFFAKTFYLFAWRFYFFQCGIFYWCVRSCAFLCWVLAFSVSHFGIYELYFSHCMWWGWVFFYKYIPFIVCCFCVLLPMCFVLLPEVLVLVGGVGYLLVVIALYVGWGWAFGCWRCVFDALRLGVFFQILFVFLGRVVSLFGGVRCFLAQIVYWVGWSWALFCWEWLICAFCFGGCSSMVLGNSYGVLVRG